MRTSAVRKDAGSTEHLGAVAVVEDLGACLGLPLDYLRGLAERVTEQPWDKLDTAGVDAVSELLAEALHRTLNRMPALAS